MNQPIRQSDPDVWRSKTLRVMITKFSNVWFTLSVNEPVASLTSPRYPTRGHKKQETIYTNKRKAPYLQSKTAFNRGLTKKYSFNAQKLNKA